MPLSKEEGNYRVIERRSHIIREDELERLYQEGWELVAAHSSDGTYAFFYYFKKRVSLTS